MADGWKVDLLGSARRDLEQLAEERGDDACDEVLQDILDLEEDPTPAGSIRLRGTKDFYRIRTYRSIYRIILSGIARKEASANCPYPAPPERLFGTRSLVNAG